MVATVGVSFCIDTAVFLALLLITNHGVFLPPQEVLVATTFCLMTASVTTGCGAGPCLDGVC